MVNKEEIILCLEEIYETQGSNVFIKATHLVDSQKVPLYHIDIFKQICAKELEFPLARLLPFEVFLTPGDKQAFTQARKRISSEITVQNFWVVFFAIEMMFGEGEQICKMLIEKISR